MSGKMHIELSVLSDKMTSWTGLLLLGAGLTPMALPCDSWAIRGRALASLNRPCETGKGHLLTILHTQLEASCCRGAARSFFVPCAESAP